jgi:hypothetical protein
MSVSMVSDIEEAPRQVSGLTSGLGQLPISVGSNGLWQRGEAARDTSQDGEPGSPREYAHHYGDTDGQRVDEEQVGGARNHTIAASKIETRSRPLVAFVRGHP